MAIYTDNELITKQRESISDNSSYESDKYEELIVNPTLLTLARQRGNIDCGGLDFLIISYGNFNQVIKEINRGHISICLDKKADLSKSLKSLFSFLHTVRNIL
ncbi:MAG: hypothetical protein EPN88_01930 [Bacteroidetes bacterium]|nr:MAG: hypothetical protein EPN88_01930 [Bacteroidota bacterium]